MQIRRRSSRSGGFASANCLPFRIGIRFTHAGPGLRGLTDRNRTTLTDAFVANKAALTRYIATFFVQREDIEDTLQQAFADALTSEIEKGVAIESPKAYLFRVARNIALNKKKRQRIVFIENVGIVDDSITGKWQETSGDLGDQQYSRDKLGAFGEAVATLPPQCRRVFMMQRYDGLTYKEIASRLDISTSTVEKHLAKALRRCTDYLVSKGFDTTSETTGRKVSHLDDYRQRHDGGRGQ
ncbi:MAG: RNA polymerase sigma factor [Gammaproteobacteria bacterium]|nr:RNA polymerase sigma factor [Gammaproteobacteria bacterium]MYF28529.1 RNA polymerase sigma factor [Gammaproteobacteria bacterium]MYK45217.1 RNA polymerase sigma factor [Gammaproteobacteria bacterium]